jgi:hypothetical protein
MALNMSAIVSMESRFWDAWTNFMDF